MGRRLLKPFNLIMKPHRQTKIIFTIGPTTESEEMLRRLILEGVDICRINMAHATHEWTKTICRRIRKVCKEVGRDIALLMDVKGPEIRTNSREDVIELKVGDKVELLYENDPEIKVSKEDGLVIGINYPLFHEDISVKDIVLVDNGLISLHVDQIVENRVFATVKEAGPLGSKRHINLPGVRVNLPSLTQKDLADLKVAFEENIDFVALSFVREPDDIDLLRSFLNEHQSRAKIIAKIEEQQGLKNLEAITKASDGVMVARGDLGIECPLEELPIIQHKMIKGAILEGKFVIVATHMLESMIHAPVPTRAEVSDIANAILEQSDCVMLSGETTTGKYPLECVRVINKISGRMEALMTPKLTEGLDLKHPKAMMLRSAATLAMDLKNTSILLFTRSGYLPRTISSLRPNKVPVFAFTDVPHIYKSMHIQWGIEPFLIDFDDENPERTVHQAIEILTAKNWIQQDEYIVTMTNLFNRGGTIESIQLRSLEEMG